MTLEELLERIKRLDVSLIENMSSDVLVRLTDRFDKSLVMYMVCKGDTTNEQRRILKVLRNAYKEWKLSENMFWGMSPHSSETYPEYFIQMKLDIECGILITEDRIPTDKGRKIKELEARIEELEKNQPEEMSEEDIDAICDTEEDNKMLLEKGSHSVKTGEEIEDPDDLEHLQARIKELEAENKELKAENAKLRKQLEECQNQNIEQPEVKKEDWIVELLSHLCYEDEQVAKDFLEKIRGLKDTEIADIVAEWVKDNKISLKSCRRDLWRILHAAKLYEGTESNYNTAMRQRQ